MSKLYDVNLSNMAYPCLEYAMLRTGCNVGKNLMFDFKSNYRELTDSDTDPEIGDIVVWGYSRNPLAESRLILEKNTVITVNIGNNFHVGVLEGNNVVSDLTVDDNGIPYIRFRYLDTTPEPTKFFRRKDDDH